MLTEEKLAELERLDAERTQGEWCVDGFHTSAVIVLAGGEYREWLRVANTDTEHHPNPNWYQDTQFIAALANAFPDLLSRARDAERYEKALAVARRVFLFDLRRMRVFGEHYNQAVVDAGDQVSAALSQGNGGGE